MKSLSPKISFYIIRSILPYFGFSWLLLSVILFVQQASRYSDIFFNNSIPSILIWQLTIALIPNVISFTCPMAILIAVIIGLTKMQGDSELVVIRAVGVGNLHLTVPVVILGVLLSVFAFVVNLKGVPFAAQIVRKVALQTALYKLESPIEPGVFNTEVQGYTIYVKDVDFEKGQWKNIFVYNENKVNNQVSLITSTNGRIDNLIKEGNLVEKAENTELVLENASVNTFSLNDKEQKLIVQTVKEFRVPIKTKKKEIAEKLAKSEENPEELGLSELAEYAERKAGKEKIEAQILWQRRILLSLTPLAFAILGVGIGLSSRRGGRGWGIFLALISLIIYYLVALLSEQLARTEKISVLLSGLIPLILTSLAIFWFFLSQRLLITTTTNFLRKFKPEFFKNFGKFRTKKSNFSLSAGILDFDIISSLVKYFLLTLSFLTVIYIIFTAFELWKFAGTIPNGVYLLFKYLIHLLPFIYIQISPSALMVATIATYIIKSRNNEVVTWTAAGRSIYRLLLPCYILMLAIGLFNWGLQEKVAPVSNQIQDTLRSQIRNKGTLTLNSGMNWVATPTRIYSFEIENKIISENQTQRVKNLSIFEFGTPEVKLNRVIKVSEASWQDNKILFLGQTEQTIWQDGIPQKQAINYLETEILESYNPFNQIPRKPNHLTSNEIANYVEYSESEIEKKIYSIALEKRKATIFLPLIITLFTAPFALSLNRKGKAVTIGYAALLWLVFIGVINIFEQFGSSGFFTPQVAIWSPLIFFTFVGVIFLTRIKT